MKETFYRAVSAIAIRNAFVTASGRHAPRSRPYVCPYICVLLCVLICVLMCVLLCVSSYVCPYVCPDMCPYRAVTAIRNAGQVAVMHLDLAGAQQLKASGLKFVSIWVRAVGLLCH